MNNIGWKRLRILVTNKCNYRCPFCHNEGQLKTQRSDMMSYEDFKKIIDCLKDQNIEELHFSGGEPFLNHNLAKMILYACKETTWDIGCATNLSLINDEQIKELSDTRVKFNIQFPYVNSSEFKCSTGNGSLIKILNNIKKVKKANLKIGLNTVLQNDNLDTLNSMIQFALENELPLKLLPQIGLRDSDKFKNVVYPILNTQATQFIDKGTGAVRWIISNGVKCTSVLYIDSPCFYHDIQKCKYFGELRIHPDFVLQSCLMKNEFYKLSINDTKNNIVAKLAQIWKDFKSC